MADKDKKIDPLDVGALEKSLNDSATRVSTIWVSFLAFGLYLMAATVNVSSSQLFLADAMKLPVLGIDLPLVGFFLFGPALFVIFHIYVLLQLLLLARTALVYNDAVEHSLADGVDRARIRQRLANTLFAQILAGSPREREGALGMALKVMALITLAIAPLLVLLSFEIRFLPYHSPSITWVHRLLIAVDLLAVLLLWPAILDPSRDVGVRELKKSRALLAAMIGLLLFAIVVPTFPGEPHAMLTRWGRDRQEPSPKLLPECNARSWFDWLMPANFDRFWLSGEELIEDPKIAKAEKARKARRQFALAAEQSRDFRGRNFSCGWFVGAGLRYADFSHAIMRGAVLGAADLEGVSFIGTDLKGADFFQARLQRARLGSAQLAGVTLFGASLQGTEAVSAQLDGADLSFAQLQGANWSIAGLRGADLTGARLEGADLRWAGMQGANLSNADLRGTNLGFAQLEGADLSNAWLEGANLEQARLQGALLHHAKLKLSLLSKPFVWRAQGVDCSGAQLIDPNSKALIAANIDSIERVQVEATHAAVETFVGLVLSKIPEVLRDDLRTKMRARLIGDAQPEASPLDCGAPKSAAEYQAALNDAMADLICNLGFSRRYVAERLHVDLNIGALLSHLEDALAAGLINSDGRTCAGEKLEADTMEAMRNIVAKRRN